MPDPLPIDDVIPAIATHLREHRAVVVTAAPGAGKTTRVPPALVADGRVLLLQPRRVAARSIARRIAFEQGWTVGREVGWHVRFDRVDSADTRLLVATEGILNARFQQDPLLSDVTTLVLDEFHERSIHADLGLAFARQAWLARDDLRIVVMSATMDARRVSAFLAHCPTVEVPGRTFPVDVVHRPGMPIEDVVSAELPADRGALLCFLPGTREIRKATEAIERRIGNRAPVLPLYGGLDADAQDAALVPAATPRVILATNIAETTLTVPDVRVVVDAGWQKVARYDVERGLDSLETERISQDAADQRAGRAGRVAAGRAVRLWDSRERLRAHREPDIARIDLAGAVMDVIAWGGDPRTFAWFESPPAGAIDRTLELLRSIGVLDDRLRLTPDGRIIGRLPLHPRLGRLLLDTGGAPNGALACALLAERHFLPPSSGATSCDLLSAIDRARDMPWHVRRVAEDLRSTAKRVLGDRARARVDDDEFRRAVLAAYPDRVARRREQGSDKFLLASGTGARLGRESGVVGFEFIAAVDVTTGIGHAGIPAADAVVRIATGIEREWLTPTSRDVDHTFDVATGRVRAMARERIGAVVVREHDVPADPEIRARLLAAAAREKGPSAEDAALLRRLATAGVPMAYDDLVDAACVAAESLAGIAIATHIPATARRVLEQAAPATLPLPSGRTARLDYTSDGRIVAAVKLQELFGLADTPRIGPSRTPVTFELLAPNGRPVQVTTDLRSFWNSGYQEVRRELRGRYPRHPWPDDPWTATPTHRTVRKKR